jgi:RNA polymerase sigma factor (sigma-70 family)
MSETDLELLRCYAREHAEEAFADVVQRHLGLVHSAALRQVRSTHLAEEIAQSVFVDLARNARRLAPNTVVAGWLYEVTRRTAIDVLRRESRRELREQTAEELNSMNSTEPDWMEIAPLLEEAMATLEPGDRAAILLRYFENKSLREVGRTLGASENAAQKRVSRALDRLHRFFRSKDIPTTAGALALLISGNAVQSTPLQLGATIATAAVQAGAAAVAGTTGIAVKTLFMSTTQKAIMATAFVAAVGTGIYEAGQASRLRAEVRGLKARVPLTENIESLTRERDHATNQLASLMAENEQLKRATAELFKLRGEVTRLKSDARSTENASAGNPVESAARDWLGRVALLKQRLAKTPEANVPELRLLDNEDWLSAVQEPKLETEKDYRKAMSALRSRAQHKFAPNAEHAVHKYLEDNNQTFPTDLSQLQPYLDPPVDPDILQRFSIVPADSISGVQMGGEWVISQANPVDEEFDSRFVIGPNGYGSTSWTSELLKRRADEKKYVKALTPVFQAFVEANGGREPANLTELRSFLETDEQRAALQKLEAAEAAKEAR